MKRKGWYLIAYDISSPGRLAKVHRIVKKQGISAQRSLFFVLGTEEDIHHLLDQIAAVMRLKEDDLRAYPIGNPKHVWTSGDNPLAAYPAMLFGETDRSAKGLMSRILEYSKKSTKT